MAYNSPSLEPVRQMSQTHKSSHACDEKDPTIIDITGAGTI